MSTLDDVEDNELPIIAKENGEITVWKCWKRAICAFNDPAMWEGTAKFADYFEPLDSQEWGMAGYGMIVMDFDAKCAISLNDYSSPASLHFPMDNLIVGEDDPSNKSLLALLSRPGAWPHVSLVLAPERGLALRALDQLTGKAPALQTQVTTLDQLLPAGIDPDSAAALLTIRGGLLKVNGGQYLLVNGEYLPDGWSEVNDQGMAMPGGLLDILQGLKDTGFPPPRWDGIDDALSGSHELPITDAAIEAVAEGIEEEDPEIQADVRALQDMGRAYIAFKQEWTGAATAKPARSGP